MGKNRRPCGLTPRTVALAWGCLLLAGFLAGCANIGTARSVEPMQPLLLAPGEAVVFGRILFTGNGKNLYPYGSARPAWIIQQRPGRACIEWPDKAALRFPFLSTDERGEFRYVLPTGHYVVDYVNPYTFSTATLPFLEFDVPAGNAAYYLGELAIDIDMRSPFFGATFATEVTRLNFLEVIDRFEEDRRVLTDAVPDMPPESIRRAVMQRIPGCFPQLQTKPGGSFVMPSMGSVKFGK